MIGLIQQVEIKDTQYRVQINNIWYGVFNKDFWPFLKVGNEIEFEYSQNGQYKNIKKAVHLNTSQNSATPMAETHSALDDRILKSLCLKIAGNSYAGYDMYKPSGILTRAKDLYDLIKKDGWL